MKKAVGVLVVLVLLVAAMWQLLPTAHDRAIASRDRAAATSPVVSAPAATAVQQATEGMSAKTSLADYAQKGGRLGDLPASLAGTQVDGRLMADDKGNLVLDVGVRHTFDYFLSTLGEESLEDIKARLAFYIQQQLPAPADQQAWDLLGRYLSYRAALASVPAVDTQQGQMSELRAAIDQRQQQRTAWLGDVASAAFFGPETAYDHYTLSRMQIEQNASLSAADKQQRLEALQHNQPIEVQQMIEQTMAPADAANKVSVMRAQGASETAIQAYREDQFGAEAAERFQQLDAQRAAWQDQYDDYRAQRQAIVNAGLSQADQDKQIAALRQRLFSDNEQKRVAALDEIARQQASAKPPLKEQE